MNDFTKDELESIIDWSEVYCFGSKLSEIVHRPLIDKIQSMIDNYDAEELKVISNFMGEDC